MATEPTETLKWAICVVLCGEWAGCVRFRWGIAPPMDDTQKTHHVRRLADKAGIRRHIFNLVQVEAIVLVKLDCHLRDSVRGCGYPQN